MYQAFVRYIKTTGEIVQSGVMDASLVAAFDNTGDLGTVSGEGDRSVHWVNAGAIVPKTASPVALSGSTLSNMAVPSRLTVDADTSVTTSSTVVLSLAAGVHSIRIECAPHFPLRLST